jgi:hypothetical protein
MKLPDYYTPPEYHSRQNEIDALSDQLDAMLEKVVELDSIDGEMTDEQEAEYDNLCDAIEEKQRQIDSIWEA